MAGRNAGLGEDRDSLAAFLFSWPSAADSASAEPIKLPKVQLRRLHNQLVVRSELAF